MKRLIWFSEIKWDYLVTRKQQILNRFPSDIKILFIEPFVIGKQQNWLPRRHGNITVLTIPFLKTIPQPLLASLFNLRVVRWIFAMVGSLYFKLFSGLLGFSGGNRVIGLSSAFWGKIAARQKANLHFYDANDAHLDFPGTPEWLEEYLRAYLTVAKLCFSVSPEISSSIESLGARNIHLLGNGVDFDHFSTPQPTPDRLNNVSRPILGYAGAMDWLDPGLIREVCLANTDHEIVLIGPEIRPGWFENQPAFNGLDNLSYLGKVSYQDLPAYVQTFKIALIPFVVDELTKPLNPNKLYEYSAAGKPVVSMNYSSTIDALSKVIFVGKSYAEFVSQIQSAFENHQPELSRSLAMANSWDEIALNMSGAIQRELSRREA
ncbi:MAG: glycosyltransferase [FCB group bacterium]|nr:glycosyltransferase [FCB group bacterium]